MDRLLSVLVAEGVSLDQLTGRVTAFNMVDHVLVPQLPAMLLRLVVITQYRLNAEVTIFQERVRLLAPNEDQLSISNTTIMLAPRTANALPNGHRSIHMLWSTKLTSEGDHRIVVDTGDDESGWTELQTILITVVKQDHPILNQQAPLSIPAVPQVTPSPPDVE